MKLLFSFLFVGMLLFAGCAEQKVAAPVEGSRIIKPVEAEKKPVVQVLPAEPEAVDLTDEEVTSLEEAGFVFVDENDGPVAASDNGVFQEVGSYG